MFLVDKDDRYKFIISPWAVGFYPSGLPAGELPRASPVSRKGPKATAQYRIAAVIRWGGCGRLWPSVTGTKLRDLDRVASDTRNERSKHYRLAKTLLASASCLYVQILDPTN